MGKSSVLLIGGGWIAETVYVPFLYNSIFVDKIIIADVDSTEIRKRYKQYPSIGFINIDMMEDSKFDFVFILSPNFMHCRNILNFLNRETIIFAEKPICINEHEYEQLKERLEKKSEQLFVSTPLRFRKDFRQLHDSVTRGEIGSVYRILDNLNNF